MLGLRRTKGSRIPTMLWLCIGALLCSHLAIGFPRELRRLTRDEKCRRPIESPRLSDVLNEIGSRLEYCDVYTAFDHTMDYVNTTRVLREVETSMMTEISCDTCKLISTVLQHFIRIGTNDATILSTAATLCIMKNYSTERVCRGFVETMGIEILQVLKQIQLTPFQICSFLVGDGCPEVPNPSHEWDIKLPRKPRPQVHYIPERDTPRLKVLQITDMHWDPYYEAGSNADCDEPLCCRATNGIAASQSAVAGKWGDYRNCDTPMVTIDSMIEHIKNTHPDIDYIMWTGDLPPHDIWNYTKEESLRVLRTSVDKMLEAFPDTPIYPTLGNHESVPCDSFPTESSSAQKDITWLYDEIQAQWLKFLPNSTADTIKHAGFYSIEVRPGLRIITINNNYCSNKNWWLLIDSKDPRGQLLWLSAELTIAEARGEKVHILGHIPPGNGDCVKVWSRNFHKIIDRFSTTVVAQFYGHTHFDEFEVFYDEKVPKRPSAVAYVAPSVSPYSKLNPAYRIYYVDGDHPRSTRYVMDHETWIIDLEEANQSDEEPRWFMSYNARELYDMPSLMPSAWDQLITRMKTDKELFDKYYKQYYSEAKVRPPCDEECRLKLLCDMRSGRSHYRKELCKDLFHLF